MTTILLMMDVYNKRRVAEMLRNDGFKVVDAKAETAEQLLEEFEAADADVLFMEPGMPGREHYAYMRTVYEVMKQKPIVFCSASDLEWRNYFQGVDIDVTVTGHCGLVPKDSFKEEVKEALGAKVFEYDHYCWQLSEIHTNLEAGHLFHIHANAGATAINVANGIGDPHRWEVKNYQKPESTEELDRVLEAFAFLRDYLADKNNRKALARMKPKTLLFGWNRDGYDGVRIRIQGEDNSDWSITPEDGIVKDLEKTAA